MIKITELFKRLFLAGVFLLLTNCATTEIDEHSNVKSIDEAKNWYNTHRAGFDSPILEYAQDLKWENAIVSNGKDGEVIEIPFTLIGQMQSSNVEASLYNDHHRLVFIKDEEQKFKTYYVQIFTDNANENHLDENYGYYGMKENFDGKVFVQDLSTGKNSKLQFNDGKKIVQSQTAKMREAEITCVWIGYWEKDGSFTPVKLLYCEGGGGSEEDLPPSYGGGGGGSSSGTPSPIKPQITSTLTGKAKCLNDLLDKKGNSFVQSLFSKFEGTSKFDIAISSADVVVGKKNGVEREINGRTLMPKGKLIEIEISTSRVNARAPIEVARIILHEYIHADIFRKLGTVLAMNVENLDFKSTYEKYEGEHHSTMATLYIDSMKEALKQFHQSLFPGDIKAYTDYYGEAPSDAFYEALAWGGLRDEDVKAWNELSAAKKASIEALASRVERFSKTSPCSN